MKRRGRLQCYCPGALLHKVFSCGSSFPAFLWKFVCYFPEHREKSVERWGKLGKSVIIPLQMYPNPQLEDAFGRSLKNSTNLKAK
jgi:hypothetical protein